MIFLVIAGAIWPHGVSAQTRTADSLAVLRLVQRHADAMKALRPELQAANYAPDATWINAFGRRREGRDSIVAFLRELYANPDYRESRMLQETPPEVRFVRADVAIVHEFHEREGRRMPDGSVISRRVHTTFVVSKEAGVWLIQCKHIADERPRTGAP